MMVSRDINLQYLTIPSHLISSQRCFVYTPEYMCQVILCPKHNDLLIHEHYVYQVILCPKYNDALTHEYSTQTVIILIHEHCMYQVILCPKYNDALIHEYSTQTVIIFGDRVIHKYIYILRSIFYFFMVFIIFRPSFPTAVSPSY